MPASFSRSTRAGKSKPLCHLSSAPTKMVTTWAGPLFSWPNSPCGLSGTSGVAESGGRRRQVRQVGPQPDTAVADDDAADQVAEGLPGRAQLSDSYSKVLNVVYAPTKPMVTKGRKFG